MDYTCPVCTKDELSLGTNMLFSICRHQICEECSKKMFKDQLSILCPLCRRALRREDLSSRFHEEKEVEEDFQVRRRVMNVMNKLEEDFPTREEFNDYLEQIENIVSELIRGDRAEDIQAQLQKYQVEHQGEIESNRVRNEELLKQLKKKAILGDSVYNENLREEARDILEEDSQIMDLEPVVLKEMPDGQNIDSAYSLAEMDPEFRARYLRTSGFNVDADYIRGRDELRAYAELALF